MNDIARLSERAWQTVSNDVYACEGVLTEREWFMAGYAAAVAHIKSKQLILDKDD